MNYSKIYNDLIENAVEKGEIRKKQKDEGYYFENHHIIPSSLGGSNDKDNMVLLTAREHYICHWLLYKITPCKETAFSWWMMSNNNGNEYHEGRKIQTSRKYEYARNAFSKHIGEVHKGKKLSDEHRHKLSVSKIGDNNPMYGKKHSDEHKAYLSEINSGEKNGFYGKTHTKETKEKISNAAKLRVGEKSNRYGKTHTEETKKKLSEANKGKPRSKPHDIVKCPHCGKEGIKPNMMRWHFDNCKK